VVLLVWLAVALAGCSVPGVPLSQQARSSVRSVSINSHVAPPEARYWNCGCWYMRAIGRQDKLRIRESSRHLFHLIRDDFEAGLRNNGVFPEVLLADADAEVTLRASKIMLAAQGGICASMNNCFNAQVEIEGILRTPSGTILWQQSAFGVGQLHALSAFNDNPEFLRQEFSLAAQKAVGGARR
jgi:hypothetical protein